MSDTPETDSVRKHLSIYANKLELEVEKLERERDEARKERDVFRDKMWRICYVGFGNDDTISGELADDYVLRKLAELRAEVEQLKSERENWRVSSVCRELKAEVERLKADKARLDWLENAKSAEYCEGPCGWSINGWKGPYRDTLREAIDSAMKGDK